jgi:hypothetical protein
MKYKLLVAVLIGMTLAGTCKAVKDTLAHHYHGSVFERLPTHFWGPDSWKNKYRDYDAGDHRPAVLVTFTDAWHLFGLLEHIGILCGGLAGGMLAAWTRHRAPWAIAVGLLLWVGSSAIFHLLYHYILA